MTKITYQQEYRTDNKTGKTYGPYWYGYWRENGKLKKRYYGKSRPPDDQADDKPPSANLGTEDYTTLRTTIEELQNERDTALDMYEEQQAALAALRKEKHTLEEKVRMFSEMAMPTHTIQRPITVEHALDSDPLLVELLKNTGRKPTGILKLVQKLKTSREMLSNTLRRCTVLWKELGIVMHDATPGTGSGLWIACGDGAIGYTWGRISREERAEVAIPLASDP